MQTLTPTSTATNTNWTVTGSTAESALSDASDDTYVTCANTTNEIEVVFTTPSQTPLTGHSRARVTCYGAGNIAWRFLEGSTSLQTGTICALFSVAEVREINLTAQPSAWSDLRLEFIATNVGAVIEEVRLDVADGAKDPSDPQRKRGCTFFSRIRRWRDRNP